MKPIQLGSTGSSILDMRIQLYYIVPYREIESAGPPNPTEELRRLCK